MSKPLKILFKYPSRGRKEYFLQSLDSILSNIHDKDNCHILVTADIDDKEMRELPQHIYDSSLITVRYGNSKSKIDAVNRDMEFSGDWDILIVMSDDMAITFDGFDVVIRNQFKEYGLDTFLHIPDQDAKHALATMYIAGKDFYNRFGYIYHPDYLSLFCDNEVHEVAIALGKYRYLDFTGLIAHYNPAYGHREKDEMFKHQQEIGWTIDQQTYINRKIRNFDIHLLKK